jgi:hypothetical protein
MRINSAITNSSRTFTQPFRAAPAYPEGSTAMRKRLRTKIEVKVVVNVASCLGVLSALAIALVDRLT